MKDFNLVSNYRQFPTYDGATDDFSTYNGAEGIGTLNHMRYSTLYYEIDFVLDDFIPL